MIRARLSRAEWREAKQAGYPVIPVNRKGSIFGSMLSWMEGVRSNGFPFFTSSGEAKAPVNRSSSNTGQIVSPASALTLSTAWACVWLNARVMASLPLELIRYQGAKGTPAETDPLYTVLRWQPSRDVDSFNFWCAMWAAEQLWGIGPARKIMNGGKVVALDFLLPQFLTTYLTDAGQLRYRYDHPRKPLDLSADDVFRVQSRTLDGYTGASVIEYGRHSFGLAQSGELAASQTFKKGLNASGFIKTDKFLKEDQRDQFRESVEEFAGEGEKAGGIMVLEGGSDFTQLSMKPLDAELLSSRQFSVEDICRWFNVPPILVGHASAGQTMWGSGVEQILGGWLRLGLRPFITASTQAIRSQLIAPADRLTLMAEYDLEDLLAPDSAARAQLYSTLSQNGIKTRNELREREGDGPMPGGDVLTVQSNLVPLDQLAKLATGGGGAGGPAQKLRDALLELLALETPPPSAKREEKP